MKNEFYAHSREGKPSEEWHRLEYHLKKVAEMAQEFASDFGAGDWAYLAGLRSREVSGRLQSVSKP
jgi:CRISPR-associated endonuclease/helicase Cas3